MIAQTTTGRSVTRITCTACGAHKLTSAYSPGTREPRRARWAVCRACRGTCAQRCRDIVQMAGSQEKAARTIGIGRRQLYGYMEQLTYPATEIRQAIDDTHSKLREERRAARWREAMARSSAKRRRKCARCKSYLKSHGNLWCAGCLAWARKHGVMP